MITRLEARSEPSPLLGGAGAGIAVEKRDVTRAVVPLGTYLKAPHRKVQKNETNWYNSACSSGAARACGVRSAPHSLREVL